MLNENLEKLKNELVKVVGAKNVLTGKKRTKSYRTGIRIGGGKANAVVFPHSLIELWRLLQVCVSLDQIIIMQAANTGLTGGSTPDGELYDRDIVIINTLYLDKIQLINKATQIIAFPGATLFELENILAPYKRSPHSIIGSSCIGASIVGGVCNNSGGNLVNRGPAYTELSLYARVNKNGTLELVNNLNIDLGKTPEDILLNLSEGNFDSNKLTQSNLKASDQDYKHIVRDYKSSTPARYNADPRCLHESSGCAGKIAVFAVRLDTFECKELEKVFFIGTNQPNAFNEIRERILSEFDELPDMGEYMHKSFFDGADKYGKDNFLLIKYLGKSFIPKLFKFKRDCEFILSYLPFISSNIIDHIFYLISLILPDHLPKRVRDFRKKYDHYLIIQAGDSIIEKTSVLLSDFKEKSNSIDFFECSENEGKDILLHRFVAGSAPKRFKILKGQSVGKVLPLDVALPRNYSQWHGFFTDDIISEVAISFSMSHFFCMVFHWDFVLKKEADLDLVKKTILNKLDTIGAKYPAEHNVGHFYKADPNLADFYQELDPKNIFNAGVGKTSKYKDYK